MLMISVGDVVASLDFEAERIEEVDDTVVVISATEEFEQGVRKNKVA